MSWNHSQRLKKKIQSGCNGMFCHLPRFFIPVVGRFSWEPSSRAASCSSPALEGSSTISIPNASRSFCWASAKTTLKDLELVPKTNGQHQKATYRRALWQPFLLISSRRKTVRLCSMKRASRTRSLAFEVSWICLLGGIKYHL